MDVDAEEELVDYQEEDSMAVDDSVPRSKALGGGAEEDADAAMMSGEEVEEDGGQGEDDEEMSEDEAGGAADEAGAEGDAEMVEEIEVPEAAPAQTQAAEDQEPGPGAAPTSLEEATALRSIPSPTSIPPVPSLVPTVDALPAEIQEMHADQPAEGRTDVAVIAAGESVKEGDAASVKADEPQEPQAEAAQDEDAKVPQEVAAEHEQAGDEDARAPEGGEASETHGDHPDSSRAVPLTAAALEQIQEDAAVSKIEESAQSGHDHADAEEQAGESHAPDATDAQAKDQNEIEVGGGEAAWEAEAAAGADVERPAEASAEDVPEQNEPSEQQPADAGSPAEDGQVYEGDETHYHDAEEDPEEEHAEHAENRHEEFDDEDEDADDSATLDTLPPIVLVLDESDRRALFEPFDDSSVEVLLPGMSDDLAQAPLSSLFAALRSTLEWDQGDEAILHEHSLDLRVGEDNRHADDVTLADLADLHRRCNVDEPMVLHLTIETGRFISKVAAIKAVLDEAEARAADGEFDDGDEDAASDGYGVEATIRAAEADLAEGEEVKNGSLATKRALDEDEENESERRRVKQRAYREDESGEQEEEAS